MKRDGLLYLELASKTGLHAPWPWFCAGPDPASFLLSWSSHADAGEKRCALQKCGPPWPEAPIDTALSIDRHIYGMALNPSGRYLAVAHAAGDWKATLWDLVENRLAPGDGGTHRLAVPAPRGRPRAADGHDSQGIHQPRSLRLQPGV